jgi:ribonuclease P protein component
MKMDDSNLRDDSNSCATQLQDISASEPSVANEIAMPNLHLHKSERLHHKALVDRLFANGKSTYAYPLRMIYLLEPTAFHASAFRSRHISDEEPEKLFKNLGIAPLQAMVTVPKKKHHKAVDRVLLRRRIREAWRLSRPELKLKLEGTPYSLSVALLYVSPDKVAYSTIKTKIEKLIATLVAELDKALLTPPPADESQKDS